MNANRGGTYKLPSKAGSVIITINAFDHIDYCDDSEQLSGTPSEFEPHRGALAQYVRVGMAGRLFVNESFFQDARKLA